MDDEPVGDAMTEFSREVVFSPAFDKRTPNPKTDYGFHGVEMKFFLTGPAGVVQFVVYTGWQLPHVQQELDSRPLGRIPYASHKPLPADIGYHSPKPMYENQSPMSGDCDLLGGPCYYDGSSLNAARIFETFLKEGSAGVWREMETFYRCTFESVIA